MTREPVNVCRSLAFGGHLRAIYYLIKVKLNDLQKIFSAGAAGVGIASGDAIKGQLAD